MAHEYLGKCQNIKELAEKLAELSKQYPDLKWAGWDDGLIYLRTPDNGDQYEEAFGFIEP